MNKREYKIALRKKLGKNKQWEVQSWHEGKYPMPKIMKLKFFTKDPKNKIYFAKTLNKPFKILMRIGGYFGKPLFSFKLLSVPIPKLLDKSRDMQKNNGTSLTLRRYDEQ